MKTTASFNLGGLLGSFLSSIYGLNRIAWCLALLTAVDGLATSFMLKYGDANMKNGWASLGLFTVAISSAALVCSAPRIIRHMLDGLLIVVAAILHISRDGSYLPGRLRLEYFCHLGLSDYTW